MTSQRVFDNVNSLSLRHHLAYVQLLMRHLALFLDFDRPMPWCIHRLKNYKIMSSERAGLNNEQSILAITLSSLALLAIGIQLMVIHNLFLLGEKHLKMSFQSY